MHINVRPKTCMVCILCNTIMGQPTFQVLMQLIHWLYPHRGLALAWRNSESARGAGCRGESGGGGVRGGRGCRSRRLPIQDKPRGDSDLYCGERRDIR